MVDPIPPYPWALPTVDEVGALLRARTQDDNDQELGTFTDVTRPTAVEAERMIRQAANVVYGATGSPDALVCDTADQLKEQIGYWISLLAAMLIELSYFPEQIEAERSAFEHYKTLWDDEVSGFAGLVEAAAECRAGEVVPDDDNGYKSASWAFPVDVGGMVGWQTQW
jgi:hypothetical protein